MKMLTQSAFLRAPFRYELSILIIFMKNERQILHQIFFFVAISNSGDIKGKRALKRHQLSRKLPFLCGWRFAHVFYFSRA